MDDPLKDLKPQDEMTVQQVKDIRAVTAVGMMQARKLAVHLNTYGYITWEMVHKRNIGLLDQNRRG